MKIHEIKEMKDDELVKRIEEEEKNLIDLRFSHQLKQLTNTAKIKLVKRDIAKMKTILKERNRTVEKVSTVNKD
ncbi:MAG: 50S ribosomal protein L29 [Ignavibacteria bacterium GWA2_35_9]|nr:MAG: 50S ribosomal protein L29 [Ignavibacteria bacterium GWA2_35_9]OGU46878.1 MAG: 50S ribosomal protein L29 [Ignavibacteria bacterium GWB2_36_8]OGU52044.1 MAG: 50S ribosomal protein L29 [Ignavibacteria bacterium GWC2_36_12]OGV09172.1 MAG: 50S ribosomal protein L29 [Ignavibacteria bacterium RIFOXYA2_FULL_37_17]OGV10888.1 MAG: 50S ribosomal protein L29 [Ignavibacteria bacterium RIFOXYB2_FULL_36_7]